MEKIEAPLDHRATQIQKPAAGSVSEISDEEVEYVSAETVQHVILWVYKLSIRYQYFISDLISFKDVKYTFIILCSVLGIFFVTFFIGDAIFLMISINAIIVWPLAYDKKRAQIDRILGVISLNFDKIIKKIPFLKIMEENNEKESKK